MKISPKTVLNIHYRLQIDFLVRIWPSMLAVVVPAPVFPVQWVIITDIFDAFIFNFASIGSDSYNLTKLLDCLQLVGSSDRLFITTLLS